ncbi:hypothetical protein PsorP6_000612 [Peronosclerospora sorghi]|uniref:Uncharacterized protein n=1 Tax=Peronosclerospora sorghi TaxID=230839 RepID=A0ACC0WQR0_9STRA|nr:hypothetical protein PsorP6_000612 [Peronosclerospora sorghi]
MARQTARTARVNDPRRRNGATTTRANDVLNHRDDSSRSSRSVAPPYRTARDADDAMAASPASTLPRAAFPSPPGRADPDATLRMERVYEQVARPKAQAAAAPSCDALGRATTTESEGLLQCLRSSRQSQTSQRAAGRTQDKSTDDRALVLSILPRPKERRRGREDVKKVGFSPVPSYLAASGSSSSRVRDHRVGDMVHTGPCRRQDPDDERRQGKQERRKRKERGSLRRGASHEDKGATLLDVDDATVQYIDAVLVKPDTQVFNKYTRFFLDPKLEMLYQDFTAIYWFGRARWHVILWILVHLFVNSIFYALPRSEVAGMEQFILTYDSLSSIFQWTYIPIALPFAALPSDYNPFQTRWRSWVCLIIICFNLTFQVWLADASRLASSSYAEVVHNHLSCDPANSRLVSTFAGMNKSSSREAGLNHDIIIQALASLDAEQRNLAMDVTHVCSDTLVQALMAFVSLFSFLFVISIRLEFVQVVVVAVTGATIYAIVVSAFVLELQWIITFTFGTAVILLLILSYSSDRTNRRSFLSNFLVEKENENLKSSLKQAEAALQNDAAHADEERAVARILAAPEMRHLEMVHIPFAELTFLQAIGCGSMGDVIKARYFGTLVVCKRMRREHIVESGGSRLATHETFPDESALAGFRDEIELMSCLRHPNIVQFIGASWDNASNLCIVMEYLENGDMHRVLHSRLGRNFTWADPLLKMAVDVVQGMLYLHSQERPVVHRDLKSVNILCSATFGCKVGDFGLSRRYKKGVDALTTLVGTPFWLAPEIIRSERYGPEADVYSFGIVLTELETRCTPYHDVDETGLKVLMRVAHKGLRPSLPSTCLPQRRRLIEDCLEDLPGCRPTFAQVLSRLQGPVLLEIEGHVAVQPDLERRVLLRRHQERRSL